MIIKKLNNIGLKDLLEIKYILSNELIPMLGYIKCINKLLIVSNKKGDILNELSFKEMQYGELLEIISSFKSHYNILKNKKGNREYKLKKINELPSYIVIDILSYIGNNNEDLFYYLAIILGESGYILDNIEYKFFIRNILPELYEIIEELQTKSINIGFQDKIIGILKQYQGFLESDEDYPIELINLGLREKYNFTKKDLEELTKEEYILAQHKMIIDIKNNLSNKII